MDSASEPQIASVLFTGVAALCVGLIARVVDCLGT